MILFHILFAFALFGFLVYMTWTMAMQYKHAEGTKIERLLAAARGSMTILWAKFVILVGSFVGMIGDIGDLFNQPEVREYAEKLLGNPRVVAALMIGISIVTISARRRTLED